MIHDTSVREVRKQRQPRRPAKREYMVGDEIKIAAHYPPGSRTVDARIERITVKDGIKGIQFKTFVLAIRPGHSRVMSEAEFNRSVRS